MTRRFAVRPLQGVRGTATGCKGKWDGAMAHLDRSSVPCLDTVGERDALFTFVEQQSDGAAAAIYCSSPSGAFVDAGTV